MTDTMIPLSEHILKYRPLLFSLHADPPLSLSKELFDEVWPYISCVYSLKQRREQKNDMAIVEKYECRLRKSRKSSTIKDGQDIKRRHGSSIREKKSVSGTDTNNLQ